MRMNKEKSKEKRTVQNKTIPLKVRPMNIIQREDISSVSGRKKVKREERSKWLALNALSYIMLNARGSLCKLCVLTRQ